MPEDEKQQSKADLSAYTIELRQLRMEEKAMRKVFEECSGQLTQLQVPLLIFQSFLNHIQCLKITPTVALNRLYKISDFQTLCIFVPLQVEALELKARMRSTNTNKSTSTTLGSDRQPI